jgi:hypothetical protein
MILNAESLEDLNDAADWAERSGVGQHTLVKEYARKRHEELGRGQ